MILIFFINNSTFFRGHFSERAPWLLRLVLYNIANCSPLKILSKNGQNYLEIYQWNDFSVFYLYFIDVHVSPIVSKVYLIFCRVYWLSVSSIHDFFVAKCRIWRFTWNCLRQRQFFDKGGKYRKGELYNIHRILKINKMRKRQNFNSINLNYQEQSWNKKNYIQIS